MLNPIPIRILPQYATHGITYMGCFPGSLDKRDCKLSNLVPNMVIFLRMADAWRWDSGPDAGIELRSDIMPLISSASFIASLYSFIHESEAEAIELKEPDILRLITHCYNHEKITQCNRIRELLYTLSPHSTTKELSKCHPLFYFFPSIITNQNLPNFPIKISPFNTKSKFFFLFPYSI